MKKLVLPILLVGATLLGACSPGQEAAPTPEAEATATEAQEAPTQGANEAADPGIPVANEENPCLPFSIVDLLLATPYPGLPPVTSDDWVVGPEDAAVTFIEYSDIQCPACAQFEPLMVAIQEIYPDDVRVVFRHFPLTSIHDKALLGAQALEAAGIQGKFFELKNFLFERQLKNPNNPAVANLPDGDFWAGVSPDLFDEWMAERVPDLGIDAKQFLEDMFRDSIVELIKEKTTQAEALGLRGTPTLFINGNLWPEQQRSVELFSTYTELILGQEKEYDACPPTVIDENKEYSAVITTTKGDIEVDLFADLAPYAVNSFVFLAREGWYKNMGLFVTEEFAMSGDPTETGFGGSGYIFLDEDDENLNFNEAGMLSTYARLGPGLNTSSFFISRIPLTGQDNRSIFGKVTAGLDVLDQLILLQEVGAGNMDQVLSITITEK